MRTTNIIPFSLALIAATTTTTTTTTASPIAVPDVQSPIKPGDKFTLMALRSGSAIHYTHISAAQGRLFLKLPLQNTICDSDSDSDNDNENHLSRRKSSSSDYATFTLSKKIELYLYAKGVNEEGGGGGGGGGGTGRSQSSSSAVQQLFGDRSRAGQGEVGYTTTGTTGTSGTGMNKGGRRGPFVLDTHADLSFERVGFLACPGAYDGAWSVWVDQHLWVDHDLHENFDSSPLVGAPHGLKDCLGFVARAVKVETHPQSCVYS